MMREGFTPFSPLFPKVFHPLVKWLKTLLQRGVTPVSPPFTPFSPAQAAATLSRHRRDGERARVLAKMAEMRRELGLPPVVLP